MKALLSKEKTQMASLHFGQNGCCANNVGNLLSPECGSCREPEVSPQIPSTSHDAFSKFAEPEISPRIGDEYQAKLPPFVESYSRKCIKSENEPHPDQKFLIGLPILLAWINILRSHAPGPQSRSRTSLDTNNRVVKAKTVEELHHLPTAEKMSKFGGIGYILVPGLVDACWNALEKNSFLLGLYVFEKNFIEVRQFVGTKEMGAILSFYYGSFYGSREYRRWSDCRKAKSKKVIYGQRIFSGVRLQELLNRVLFGLTVECRDSILEVTKSFGDEKISLADYVFSLKTMLGIENLVAAVGIGKGKLDLTEMPLESSRSYPTRHEIPTGKALSSLTTDQIIKFLSPDYRLSKTRSNDIFWEAVWPRLLANGWHSEQPNNKVFVKHCLVFLMPGIKKFSRLKLIKGEHYFDSVTDVLSRVAKEPELINLDFEEEEEEEEEGFSNKKEEYDSPNKTKFEKHCYLQPRIPKKRNIDLMKFTVVDTSLPCGRIRELRAFPSEISNTFTARDHKEDSGEDISEEKSNESNSIDILTAKSYKKTALVLPDLKNRKDLREKDRTKKVPRARKAKRDNVDTVDPFAKRCRRLTIACGQKKTNVSNSGIDEVTENVSSQASPARDITSTAGSSEGGPDQDADNARIPMLIDLNLPQAPLDFETVELGRAGASNCPESSCLPGPPDTEARHEQPLNLNPRRISTRNRPPTMRVLEAVADGYLTISKKRKVKSACSNENLASRSARRAGRMVEPSERHSPVAPEIGESQRTGVPDSVNSNMVV
ncbi:hypothetical protein OROGR_014434 [Orobanche gracilis]